MHQSILKICKEKNDVTRKLMKLNECDREVFNMDLSSCFKTPNVF